MLFYVFLVRARFGPKTGGANFAPPPNEKRWKKCLMKLGLIIATHIITFNNIYLYSRSCISFTLCLNIMFLHKIIIQGPNSPNIVLLRLDDKSFSLFFILLLMWNTYLKIITSILLIWINIKQAVRSAATFTNKWGQTKKMGCCQKKMMKINHIRK